MNAQTSFYNRFSFLYPVIDVFLKPQKKRFFTEINNLPFGKLLEIGVGNGSHFKYYKNHKTTGIEISVSMLEDAKRQKNHSIDLFQMDGENLEFEAESFDYIILSHIIAVVTQPEVLLSECFRVLKPNGKLLILNHFTPRNGLRYLDKIFSLFSGIFHFKSLFYIEDFKTIKKYRLEKEIVLGKLSYFKILIYAKP